MKAPATSSYRDSEIAAIMQQNQFSKATGLRGPRADPLPWRASRRPAHVDTIQGQRACSILAASSPLDGCFIAVFASVERCNRLIDRRIDVEEALEADDLKDALHLRMQGHQLQVAAFLLV